jgi:hypothetical protein
MRIPARSLLTFGVCAALLVGGILLLRGQQSPSWLPLLLLLACPLMHVLGHRHNDARRDHTSNERSDHQHGSSGGCH